MLKQRKMCFQRSTTNIDANTADRYESSARHLIIISVLTVSHQTDCNVVDDLCAEKSLRRMQAAGEAHEIIVERHIGQVVLFACTTT